MNKHLPFIRFRRMGFLRLLITISLVSPAIGARALILGPYDMDRDGNSELLLILNKQGGPAVDWVENIPDNGIESVWSYSLPENVSGMVTNAQVFDIDNDGYPEFIISVLTLGLESSKDIPALYVFRGTASGFSDKPHTISLKNKLGVKVRPTGLTFVTRNGIHYAIISQGTPSRDLLMFSVELTGSDIERGDIETLRSELIGSGYSTVYTGNIGPVGSSDPLAVTVEDNIMRIALFNVDEMGNAGLTLEKEIPLGADLDTAVFGMGITSFDRDGNGHIEMLIPFVSGEIRAIDLSSGELLLVETDLDSRLVVLGGTENLEEKLEEIFSREIIRQEAARKAYNFTELYMTAENRDTIELGNEFFYDISPDTSIEFFSFKWESKPPAGCTFSPEKGAVTWVPERNQIGAHLLMFRYEQRQGVEHRISEDELGDTHLMVPILDEKTSIHAVLVVDSIKPEEPPTLVLDDLDASEPMEAEMFTLTLTKPTKDPERKYTFTGEPPFGVKARELPVADEASSAVLAYSVSGNLASLKPGSEASFAYMPTQDTTLYTSSLTLVQDHENNLVLISLAPKLDTIPQWIDPENYSADLYMFPHFYFEGFGATLKASAEVGGLAFRFHKDGVPERIQASIRIQLPAATPDELILNIEEGAIGEMVGNVKVKENGSKKIELVFKTTDQILPSALIVRSSRPGYIEEQAEKDVTDIEPEKDIEDTSRELTDPEMELTASDTETGTIIPDTASTEPQEPITKNDTTGVVYPDTLKTKEILDTPADSSDNE